MKHACSVCNKFFQNRDTVIKMSPATVYNSHAAYIGLDESVCDEDIIHSDCLPNYTNGVEATMEIERPEVANPISDPVQVSLSDQEDKITNAIGALKNMSVSSSDAENGVRKLLNENPNLTTQEILCGFPYGV